MRLNNRTAIVAAWLAAGILPAAAQAPTGPAGLVTTAILAEACGASGTDEPGAEPTPAELRPRGQVEDAAIRPVRHREEAGGIGPVLPQYQPGAAGGEQFRVAQLLRPARGGLVFRGSHQRHPGLGRPAFVADGRVGQRNASNGACVDDRFVLVDGMAARHQRRGQARRIERGRAEAAG